MKEYKRVYPLFSLCGLNCGLCPRYHAVGETKCPGCGGKEFSLKHPSCSVITCNKKHDNVQYCFQCSSYPCEKYKKSNEADSFISYRNVVSDFEKASREGIDKHKMELDEKVKILEFLINNYNDGRRKNFYCLAVNLLKLSDIRGIVKDIENNISKQEIDLKRKIELIVSVFENKANEVNVLLKLRK